MNTDETFTHDVLLSHSARDKAVVRQLAEQLQVAARKNLRVWFDEWMHKPAFAKMLWTDRQERRFIPLRFDNAFPKSHT